MQLHLLSVDLLHAVHHILDKLRIRGTGRVDTHNHLGFLRLLLVRPLRAHLLTIGIDGILAYLVSLHDGLRQQLIQTSRKALTTGRVADNQRRVVQPAQFLRTMIEPVCTTRHQRHQQSATHKQRRRILVLLQALADILQDGEVLAERLNLLAPLPEPSVDVILLARGHRRLRRRFRNLLIRLARCLLDSLLHDL